MTTITRALAAHPPDIPTGRRKGRIFDERTTGFLMEHTVTGKVTFWARYRDRGGRQREVRIGHFGVVTVDQARKCAQEIIATASLGGDPAAERDKLRAISTFAEFMEGRYLPDARERLRSARDHESFYRLRLKGLWGSKRLDEVTPHDVVDLQARLRREGLSAATVNRYTALVRRVFGRALRWEAYEGRNPARHAQMGREQHRERYLLEPQLRALVQALTAEPNRSAAGAIMLLAATGARRGEALGARWEHIDWDRRLWTVPLSKSGRRRHIPLSDAALAILRRMAVGAVGPWVFPGSDHLKPVHDVRKAWQRAKIAAGLDDDLRLHDLRHTFASRLVGNGRSLHEVGTILGHSQVSMTMRYAHLAPARLIEAANEALPGFR